MREAAGPTYQLASKVDFKLSEKTYKPDSDHGEHHHSFPLICSLFSLLISNASLQISDLALIKRDCRVQL